MHELVGKLHGQRGPVQTRGLVWEIRVDIVNHVGPEGVAASLIYNAQGGLDTIETMIENVQEVELPPLLRATARMKQREGTMLSDISQIFTSYATKRSTLILGQL